MSDIVNLGSLLRQELTWEHIGMILAILILARLLVKLVREAVGWAAEKAPPRLRLPILRLSPILRVVIDLAALALIVPILVEPTFQNVALLAAAVFLALAFALKDFAGSLAAGVTTILENTYQRGDWIEVDGAYGEVRNIGLRAVRLVTADDTEVVIPHSKIWTGSVANASGGNRGLLCVTDFYLDPDHDAAEAREGLKTVAESSAYREAGTPVVVIVLEKPWGTHYRVKAVVRESREQFLLMSDVTVRGKEALRGLKIGFARAPYLPAVR